MIIYPTLSKAIWHTKRDKKVKLYDGFYVYYRKNVGFFVIGAWDRAIQQALVRKGDILVASGSYEYDRWNVGIEEEYYDKVIAETGEKPIYV